MRYAAGFAAGALTILAVQYAVYFHLERAYARRFRRST